MSSTFESASASDLEPIRALLSASDLPVDDIAEQIEHFVLARSEGTTIGTVATAATAGCFRLSASSS